MQKKIYLLFVLAVATALVAACGGGAATSGSSASAENGQKIFAQQTVGSLPGCVTCHSLEAGKKLVGPSMAGIASRAGSTVSGKSAEAYIRQSIVEPDAHVVDGYPAGVMQSYQGGLTDQQLSELVAYLLTLK